MVASAPRRALVLGTSLALDHSAVDVPAIARAIDLPVIALVADGGLLVAERAAEHSTVLDHPNPGRSRFWTRAPCRAMLRLGHRFDHRDDPEGSGCYPGLRLVSGLIDLPLGRPHDQESCVPRQARVPGDSGGDGTLRDRWLQKASVRQLVVTKEGPPPVTVEDYFLSASVYAKTSCIRSRAATSANTTASTASARSWSSSTVAGSSVGGSVVVRNGSLMSALSGRARRGVPRASRRHVKPRRRVARFSAESQPHVAPWRLGRDMPVCSTSPDAS